MTTANHPILADIEQFLRETGMAETTFGQQAANGQWKLLERLRDGGSISHHTEARIRAFMASPEARAIIPRPHRHEERTHAA
jgi:hypothetical protein